MTQTSLLLLMALFVGQPQAPKAGAAPEEAARIKRERLLELYTGEALRYTIYRDSSRREKLPLRREPVYFWTNPIREGGQDGVVFVWTSRGRPEVLGCFFSQAQTGQRDLFHEFHSLSLSVLDVSRPGPHSWTPEAPGIELAPITGAPAPARTAAQRLVQMRTLTRDFTASTEDDKKNAWELRLLARPFYRYESTDPVVLDGALFSFVTSAGTDPEALLVLEARQPASGGNPVWQFAAARFTDLNLWVRHKGKIVLQVPYIPHDSVQQDPKHRYRIIHDRVIEPVEDHPFIQSKSGKLSRGGRD